MTKINLLTLITLLLALTGCQNTPDTDSDSNTPPVAIAYWENTGDLEEVVTLDASASYDDDDDQLYYQWNLVSKPTGSGVTLPASTTNPIASFIPDIAGTYQIELVVYDGQQESSAFNGTFTALDLIDLSTAPDYTVFRGGDSNADLTWVVEKNGNIVLTRNATHSLNIRYFSLTSGADFRIWLEDSAGLTVSDTVAFTVDETFNYQLSLDTNYQLSRSGIIGDQVNWVVEEDGQIVIERGASAELNYSYPGNLTGSHYRAWLTEYIDGAYTRVSNYVVYEPEGYLPYELTIDPNYMAVRNGNIGEPVLYHIEKDGSTLKYSNASDQLYWIDYSPASSSQYSVTLVTDDASKTPLSNTLSYTYDLQPQTYAISFDGSTLTRDGNTDDSVIWVLEENGRIRAEILGSGSLSYTPGSLIAPGNNYRFWLKQFIGGSYQRVSNMITHTP